MVEHWLKPGVAMPAPATGWSDLLAHPPAGGMDRDLLDSAGWLKGFWDRIAAAPAGSLPDSFLRAAASATMVSTKQAMRWAPTPIA